MMSRTYEPLFTLEEIKQALPIRPKAKEWIASARKEIKEILSQNVSTRWMIILGPCSIHDSKAILEYAIKLKELESKISKKLFLVLRFFTEKPRTHFGWKGFAYDPHLDNSFDMQKGIFESRRLLSELTDLKIPLAAELLDPMLAFYFEDFLTFGFIGSRTSSSQIHRQLASSFDFPIGFKNSSSGNLLPAILGAHSATKSHTFFSINEKSQFSKITTSGNPFTHLVLRGSEKKPNYDEKTIFSALNILKKHPPLFPKIFIDCSHGNSQGDFHQQKEIFFAFLEKEKSLKDLIAGFVFESFLKEGKQSLSFPLEYGLSITDSCMSFEETQKMLEKASQGFF